MSNAQRISISAAARLLGKNRETIRRKVDGLPSIKGDKGARLFDADDLMYAIYCGSDESMMISELSEAMDAQD